MNALALAALASTSLLTGLASAQTEVQYRVEFDAHWSAETHPVGFPNDPHFSPLVGATHSALIDFWAPGQLASRGIEVMAETGGTSPLRSEINAAISAGVAGQLFQTGGIALSPGSRGMDIVATEAHPRLTLVSMIAPSPDWFVGIHGLSLIDEQGQWVDEVIVELDPYDAGTEDGTAFSGSNPATSPHVGISNIANAFPFTGTPAIGTFTITRVTPVSCSPADLAEPFEELNFFDLGAYLEAFNAQSEDADLAAPFGTWNFFDLGAFLTEFNAGCP